MLFRASSIFQFSVFRYQSYCIDISPFRCRQCNVDIPKYHRRVGFGAQAINQDTESDCHEIRCLQQKITLIHVEFYRDLLHVDEQTR